MKSVEELGGERRERLQAGIDAGDSGLGYAPRYHPSQLRQPAAPVQYAVRLLEEDVARIADAVVERLRAER